MLQGSVGRGRGGWYVHQGQDVIHAELEMIDAGGNLPSVRE